LPYFTRVFLGAWSVEINKSVEMSAEYLFQIRHDIELYDICGRDTKIAEELSSKIRFEEMSWE
jgi:hypothetical protein